jgi:hypothetical protein
MRPRFLSQKMEQKEPEKKIPSTAAKAISRSANDAYLLSHHCRAHCKTGGDRAQQAAAT